MAAGEKIRADIALVRQGLFESRERAQAAIMEGRVFIGERRINKASEPVAPETELTLKTDRIEYVSRGALKLEKAVRVFHADLKGHVIMDIGASTGGFTDVCLQQGARRVYSIDVGYGQLDWKLRNDPRVTVMERMNARYLDKASFDEIPDRTVMDVSFISIRLILPVAVEIMGEAGIIYTLIKPQFEAGKGKIGKNGVVREAAVHTEVLSQIAAFADQMDWPILQLDYSPITGPKGNIEFIAEMRKRREGMEGVSGQRIEELVREAHRHLIHGI